MVKKTEGKYVLQNPVECGVKEASIVDYGDNVVMLNVFRDLTRGVTGSMLGYESVRKAQGAFQTKYRIGTAKPIWKKEIMKKYLVEIQINSKPVPVTIFQEMLSEDSRYDVENALKVLYGESVLGIYVSEKV